MTYKISTAAAEARKREKTSFAVNHHGIRSAEGETLLRG